MSMRMTSVGPPAAGLTVPTMCRILIRADRIASGLSGDRQLTGHVRQRLPQALNIGLEVP